MAGLRRKWKRRIAGFLAACMITTSLQGTAMAAITTDYTVDENVVVFLGLDNLKEAVAKAVTNGNHYDGSLSFSGAGDAGRASDYEKLLKGDNVFELEEIPYSNNIPSNGIPDDTGLRIFVCADETQLTGDRKASDSELKASGSELKASRSELGEDGYQVTGEEQMIFLFTNKSDLNLTFRLNVDGVLSPEIRVPNGETLGYEMASASEAEEETEEETEEAVEETTSAPVVEEGPAIQPGEGEGAGSGSAGGSGSSTSDVTDESKADEENTDESKADEGNVTDESKADEGNTTDESKADEGNVTDESKADSGNVTDESKADGGNVTDESKADSGNKTDESKADGGDKTDESKADGGNKTDESKADSGNTTDVPKSDEGSTGGSKIENDNKDKVSTDKETNNNDSKKEDDKTDKTGSDDKKDSDKSESKKESTKKDTTSDSKETEVEILSISPKLVPVVTSREFVPKDSYDLDDPDAPKSPEEEFEMMGLDDEDEDEEEYYSSYGRSAGRSEGEEIVAQGTVLEPVFVTDENNYFRFFRRGGDNGETTGAYTSPLNAFSRSNGSDFSVTLYDYSGTGADGSQTVINDYLQGKNAGIRFHWENDAGIRIGNRYSYSKGNQNLPYNVVQGLLPKAYEKNFESSFFNEADLFPDEQGEIDEAEVKVYPNVALSNDFFNIDKDGYYTYDSSKQGAQYSEGVLSPESGEKQFWPFSTGAGNWFFGMKFGFDFYMPKDGKVNNKDMIFEFSGDDDIWIYLNRTGSERHKLVFDLGGNHGRMDGTINFATGEIIYTNKNGSTAEGRQEKNVPVVSHLYNSDGEAKSVAEKNKKEGDNDYYTAYASLYSREQTITNYMVQKGVNEKTATEKVDQKYIDFMGFDGQYGEEYQLSLYYMERGGTASNCYMRFNMPVIPASGISLMKEVSGKEKDIPKDKIYSFNVVTSENRGALKAVREGGSSDEVEEQTVQLEAGQRSDLTLSAGTYFYIEETDNAEATTNWRVSGAEQGNGTGTKTEIYSASSTEGFLVTFNNSFGNLDPTINKSAWLDPSESGNGEYDIALEVTGDSMTTISGSDSGANVLFVLDKSGSMESNNRLSSLKAALNTSLNQLKDKNNVNIAMFTFNNRIDKFNNGGWVKLDDNSLSQVQSFYKDLKGNGYTNSPEALKEAKEVLGNAPSKAKKYLIFLTDGDPKLDGKNSDDLEVKAKEAGDALREKYGFDELSIYMVGVGSSINNDWWMNPDSNAGMPNESRYSSQKNVEYPTAYYQTSEDDLSGLFKEITNQIADTTSITNLTVTDTLSNHVAPVNVNSSESSDVPMSMWLYNRKLDGNAVTPEIKEDSRELTGVRNGNVITYSDGKQEIAKYYIEETDGIPAKTIVWTVAAELPAGETRTLIYRVEATGDYKENEFVDPDPDTGTHFINGETGYHSNVKAELAYNGSESKDFPHPVVRPQAPNGSIIITKEVTDTNGAYAEAKNPVFEFKAVLENISVDKISVEYDDGTTNDKDVDDNRLELSFSLEAGESYTIKGLNKEAEYTITEEPYSGDPYFSELQSITVMKNGKADESGVDVTKGEIKGTLKDNGGTRIAYSYEESTKMQNGKFVYGPREEAVEPGENGWYDKGEYIPEGDDRYFKSVGGELSKKTTQPVTTYTWEYGGHTVSSGNSFYNIMLAQYKVLDWLKEAGYVNDGHREGAKPYSVSASKNLDSDIPSVSITGTRGWRYGSTTWDDDKKPDSVKQDLQAQFIEKYGEEKNYAITENTDIQYDYKEEVYKVTATYTIYISETETVSAKEFTTPSITAWEYDGQKYEDFNSLETILRTDGYTKIEHNDITGKVTYSKQVRRTNQEMLNAGFAYRQYYSESVEVEPSNKPLHIAATYNNLFAKRDSIFVEKRINADNDVTVPEDEAYEFEVLKFNSDKDTYEHFKGYDVMPVKEAKVEPTDGGFRITGTGRVELLIDKDAKGATFQVKEVNKGKADTMQWAGRDMGTDVSVDVTNGGIVICTNYYTNNTLTISKTLSDDSYANASDAAKEFNFKVTLRNGDGTPVKSVVKETSSEGVTFAKDTVNGNNIQLSDGEFTFTLKAGDSLRLSGIPSGASYSVEEISMVDQTLDKYYSYELVDVKKNGEHYSTANGVVEGNYQDISTAEKKNQTVAYENRLTPKMGKITVRKEIVDKSGQHVSKGAKGETFIFKIENQDPLSIGFGEVFYASLEIGNSGEAEQTLEVPYGTNYTVTEEAHLRYKVLGEGTHVVQTVEGFDSATIRNYKTSDEYFSDVSVKVNKVGDKGFPVDNSNPFNTEMPKALLPSDSTREDGNEEN